MIPHKFFPDVAFLPPNRAEKLDVYFPDPGSWPGRRPAIILIHGGGWAKGDKAEPRQRQIGERLAGVGYAVFSINYRLTQFAGEILKSPPIRTCWPDCLEDCVAAVAFVRENADKWTVAPERIALFGLSAGGHLALLTAGHLVSDQKTERPVSAVLSFYGPHDVRELGSKWQFGEPCDDPVAVREAASPIRYFNRSFPPVFVAHGLEDRTVPIEFSEEIVELLGREGVPCESHFIPGAGHGFDLDTSGVSLSIPVISFLRKHLCM